MDSKIKSELPKNDSFEKLADLFLTRNCEPQEKQKCLAQFAHACSRICSSLPKLSEENISVTSLCLFEIYISNWLNSEIQAISHSTLSNIEAFYSTDASSKEFCYTNALLSSLEFKNLPAIENYCMHSNNPQVIDSVIQMSTIRMKRIASIFNIQNGMSSRTVNLPKALDSLTTSSFCIGIRIKYLQTSPADKIETFKAVLKYLDLAIKILDNNLNTCDTQSTIVSFFKYIDFLSMSYDFIFNDPYLNSDDAKYHFMVYKLDSQGNKIETDRIKELRANLAVLKAKYSAAQES